MRGRLLWLGLLLAGCSSDNEDVLDAWRQAGQTPGEFKDVGEKLPGGKCLAGKVSGLEATVCQFKDADLARKAEEAGWELLGGAVGSSVASDKGVLVIADPRKEDPSGRRIDELIKAFQKATR